VRDWTPSWTGDHRSGRTDLAADPSGGRRAPRSPRCHGTVALPGWRSCRGGRRARAADLWSDRSPGRSDRRPTGRSRGVVPGAGPPASNSSALAGLSAEVVAGDLTEPDSLVRAVTGVRTVVYDRQRGGPLAAGGEGRVHRPGRPGRHRLARPCRRGRRRRALRPRAGLDRRRGHRPRPRSGNDGSSRWRRPSGRTRRRPAGVSVMVPSRPGPHRRATGGKSLSGGACSDRSPWLRPRRAGGPRPGRRQAPRARSSLCATDRAQAARRADQIDARDVLTVPVRRHTAGQATSRRVHHESAEGIHTAHDSCPDRFRTSARSL
jgi:hypothetical protein